MQQKPRRVGTEDSLLSLAIGLTVRALTEGTDREDRKVRQTEVMVTTKARGKGKP